MHDKVMARRRAAAQAGFLNDPGAALAALDDAYMAAGCRAALGLMASESARALHRCHCAGGVLIGIDGGSVLLGRRPAAKDAARRKVAPGMSKEERESAARDDVSFIMRSASIVPAAVRS